MNRGLGAVDELRAPAREPQPSGDVPQSVSQGSGSLPA